MEVKIRIEEKDVDELCSNTDYLVENSISVGDHATCSTCGDENVKIVYMYGNTEPMCGWCSIRELN